MNTWQDRIEALQGAGMTLAEIGEKIGMSTGGVGDLATGRTKSPRGDAAMKLFALHELHCRPSKVQEARA